MWDILGIRTCIMCIWLNILRLYCKIFSVDSILKSATTNDHEENMAARGNVKLKTHTFIRTRKNRLKPQDQLRRTVKYASELKCFSVDLPFTSKKKLHLHFIHRHILFSFFLSFFFKGTSEDGYLSGEDVDGSDWLEFVSVYGYEWDDAGAGWKCIDENCITSGEAEDEDR